MDFKIKSKTFKIFLWITLVLVLISDFYSLWLLFTSNTNLPFFSKAIMLLGVGIKLGALYCLVKLSGPIKGLLYTWGGLFIVSGSFGLLAFVLSAEIEPIQNYLDKGIFLLIGLLLVIPASKYIAYTEQEEA
jgi:hypothetical protein